MKSNANINTLKKNHSGRNLHKQDPLFDLSLIINNSEENLLVIDKDYKIVLCNHIVIEVAKKTIGIDLEIGDSLFSIVLPEERERVKVFCDRALTGEKLNFDYSVNDNDGNTLYFNNIFKPFRDVDNEIVGVIILATDITEKRKAHQAVWEAEQRWRFALEGSNQGVWDWNIETDELYFSPSWRKMLGYEDHDIQNYLSEWQKLLHPDDKEIMKEHIDRHLHSSDLNYETEYRLKAKDGMYRWILSRGMIVAHSANGVPARMIGTHTDITERKKVEENYKLLFYNNPLPMWTYDKKTLKFLNVNNAAISHYGYSREEFLEMTILDIRPEEDKEKVKEIIRTNKESNLRKSNWLHTKKNGEIIEVQIASQIFEDENNPRCLVIAEDITEKIKIETKIKASEKQYRALFKTSPLPSFIYERETLKILEVNDAAIKHFGFAPKEFLQKTLFDIHAPANHKALLASIKKNKNLSVARIPNWNLINKQGEELVGEISVSSFEYNGINTRLVVINDITDKVKTEQELKKSNERFDFVAQAATETIWDWNMKTNEVLISESYHKIFGWKLGPNRILHIDDGLARFHPEDKDRITVSLKTAIENPKTTIWEEDFRYLKADGSFAYVTDRGFISRDNKGIAIRVVGTLQDISERKFQEELQTLELRVFEASAVPEMHFHKVLKTLINGYENLNHGIKASICLFGLSDEVEILAPKLAKEHSRQLRYYIEKQKNKLPARQHLQKNIIISSVDSEDWKYGIDAAGTYNWNTSWSVPVYDHGGDLLAFITVFLDQARKPSEKEENALARLGNLLRILMINHLSLEQIRISNERYDNMLRATHDLVWDWNLETGTFYRNNEGLKKVYGIEDEKSIQNVYSWMERIHPGDHMKVQRVINDILHATDEDTFDVEYRFKRDDGEYAFIYDRGVIVRNKDGKPLRMIGAAQNVTDRKKLEQELLQQELDKQKFISQATIDTQEQERREIGKELHDNVNQVLTTTKLYLDLSISSPELKDELIGKSSKNIIYVINEIRQLSRSLMDPSIGDLGLLDSINDLVENINITRKLHVSVSAPADLERYLEESQKLMIFRVIQEAMNNTLKYAQATSVQLNIKSSGGNLELLIIDDGKGFELATVKKGAGLKNIQNRVYLTGGTLLIESAVGKGCKISINLPIKNKSKI